MCVECLRDISGNFRIQMGHLRVSSASKLPTQSILLLFHTWPTYDTRANITVLQLQHQWASIQCIIYEWMNINVNAWSTLLRKKNAHGSVRLRRKRVCVSDVFSLILLFKFHSHACTNAAANCARFVVRYIECGAVAYMQSCVQFNPLPNGAKKENAKCNENVFWRKINSLSTW